jgi:hypothetical protein
MAPSIASGCPELIFALLSSSVEPVVSDWVDVWVAEVGAQHTQQPVATGGCSTGPAATDEQLMDLSRLSNSMQRCITLSNESLDSRLRHELDGTPGEGQACRRSEEERYTELSDHFARLQSAAVQAMAQLTLAVRVYDELCPCG